ncbi:ATP-binding protein [Streptomyces sp. NPDC048419]|uniref:ATP-binding protein n=1 Tax=Streptomyces sp. NPDC048419 TaxID=3365547 RepID=UPI0037230237
MAGDGEGEDAPPSGWAGAAYDGTSDSIGEARRFATDYLRRLAGEGLLVSTDGVGAVQLVVSELVTNAVKYSPGPCLLDLEPVGDALDITVWDSSLTLPTVAPPEPGRVGKHGLEIVAALSEELQARRTPIGKRITARVRLTAPDRSAGRDERDDAVGDVDGDRASGRGPS